MWLEMKTVLPLDARWRSVSRMATMPAGSRPLAGAAGRGRAGGGGGPQVRAPREVGVEGGRLDDRPDLEEPVPVTPPEGPPEDLDAARVGGGEAGGQPHRGGLARAPAKQG